MDYSISKTNFGEKPEFEYPKPLFLEEIGEDGLKKLFSDFYDLIIDSDIGNIVPNDSLYEDCEPNNIKKIFPPEKFSYELMAAFGHFGITE